MKRVEKHIITKSHELYRQIDVFSFKCKNLYNYANYIIRQEFINNGKWIRCNELWNMIKNTDVFKEVNYDIIGQQILRLLDKNWTSFFRAIKDYSKHPEKYKGKPKMPKYKHKETGRCIIIHRPRKAKDNVLKLVKIFDSFELKTKLVGDIKQIRYVPHNGYYVIEIIKEVECNKKKSDNNRYIGIDIGVDNLATVVNNIGKVPFIANGKGLKSINQYWNKTISKYQNILKKCNNEETSNRLNRMWLKRHNQINDYMHKTSRFIINYCLDNNINTIVIGHNKNWKQDTNKMKKKDRQTFVQIPFNNLINQIQYKAEEEGLTVIITEESYTSKASFLNLDEMPIYGKEKEEPIFSGYRKHRGLYKIKGCNTTINADVNGAFNIIRKVFPNVFNASVDKTTNGIVGVVVHPVKFNMN